MGNKVGLIDADIYGPNIPLMMGSNQQPKVGANNQIEPNITHGVKTISIGYISPGDKPMVMRGPMLHQIIRQFLQQVEWGELDYLLIDLPPGTGDVVISLVQTVPLTGAVVVSTPSDVALQDARKALEMFAQVNVEVLGIVENMSHFTCPHCSQIIDIFSSGGAERTAQQFNVPFLGSIELASAIREGGDRGLPVTLAGPDSPLAAEFYEAARKTHRTCRRSRRTRRRRNRNQLVGGRSTSFIRPGKNSLTLYPCGNSKSAGLGSARSKLVISSVVVPQRGSSRIASIGIENSRDVQTSWTSSSG